MIFGGGYNNFQFDDSQTKVDSTVTVDDSVGLLRMNAVLEPRHDIGVPKPRQASSGPGSRSSPARSPTSATRPPPARSEVVIVYTNSAGTPMQGKGLAITTQGVAWAYVRAAPRTRTGTPRRTPTAR